MSVFFFASKRNAVMIFAADTEKWSPSLGEQVSEEFSDGVPDCIVVGVPGEEFQEFAAIVVDLAMFVQGTPNKLIDAFLGAFNAGREFGRKEART